MIMKNRRLLFEEAMWERFENNVKMKTYALMHELLQNQISSIFIYKLLIVIETLQLFYYSIHPNLYFLWNTQFLDYLRNIVQFFQINSILDQGGSSVFLLILYLVFVLQILSILIAIAIMYMMSKKKPKNSSFLSYNLKILSIYALMLNSVLALPFFNIFEATIMCNSDAPFSSGLDCFENVYFMHFVVAFIGLIILITSSILFNILYVELNPNSKIPFASPQSKINLLKLFLKFLLPLYISLDYQGSACKVFVSILTVVYLILLVLRHRAPPLYEQSVYNFIVVSDVLLFWTTLVSLFTAFLDFDEVDNIGMFYMVVGIPLVAICYKQSIYNLRMKLLITPIRMLKRETDVEGYINILIGLIVMREQPDKRILLEGLLRLHIKNCNRPPDQCVCYILAKENMKDEDSAQKQKIWYMLVRSIMTESLDKFSKSPRLHLLNAYIHHEKLQNKFKALYELMITEENKPNIQEEFSIYRYKNQIEQEMIENDVRNTEQRGVDVNVIVLFQNNFVIFLSFIEKSVNLHLEFWRELLEENPDIQKLQSLGSKITNSVQQTNERFKILNEMNPNHINCLEIYGYFLKEIFNDDVEGQRILEKSDYILKSTFINKQFVDKDRQKYGENSNTCIITISGNYNSIGSIINVNNDVTRILGYSKSYLIGLNVNRIMSKCFADQHDGFLMRYMGCSESTMVGTERMVLAQNKQGYLVPCTLMVKVIPNLEEGIQIVGFLKDIDVLSLDQNGNEEEVVHYMIYDYYTMVVLGITQSCFQAFGIPSTLVYGKSISTNQFTLDAIAPELADPKNYESLKSLGIVATIDTTMIKENFLMGHGESDEEMSFVEDHNLFINQGEVTKTQDLPKQIKQISSIQQKSQTAIKEEKLSDQNVIGKPKNSKMRKQALIYRKAQIRAQIIEDCDFGEQRIHIIKFSEVKDYEVIQQNRAVPGEIDLKQKTTQNAIVQQTETVNHNSDLDSVQSGQSGNDEMRQLKDFKALISEKTEAKSIRILNRSAYLLQIVLVTLTAVIFAYKLRQNNDVWEGAEAIYQANLRTNIMADVNFYSRLLQMLAAGLYYPKNSQSQETLDFQIKQNISSLVDYLQNVQFTVIKNRINVQNRQTTASPLEKYPIQFLLQNNQNFTYQYVFNDALFQYITSASSLRNSSLESFNQTDEIESTQKNFFYVTNNGLFVLRQGSEKIALMFYNFYQNLIQGYDITFTIIMVFAVFFLVGSLCLLIPIVFQVHKTNNRVMSLFGIIPLQEITELSIKCENYMHNFLEDKNEKKDEEERYKNIHIIFSNKNQRKSMKLIPEPEQKELNQFDDQINEDQNFKSPNNSTTKKIELPFKSASKKRQETVIPNKQAMKDQIQERKENDEDLENIRSQKLLNSKDNNKSTVIYQFSIYALLFMSYFIVDIQLEVNFLADVDSLLNHLQLITVRPAEIKYITYFTIEQVVTGNKQIFNGDNMIDVFSKKLYENERQIFNSLINSYPPEFSPYLDQFQNFNYANLCSYTFSHCTIIIIILQKVNFTMDSQGCSAVQNGLLIKGLRTAIVTVALTTNDIINEQQQRQFNSTEDQYNQTIRDIINGKDQFDKLQYLIKYICPSIDYLNDKFMNNFSEYLDVKSQMELVKFIIFLVAMLFVFIVFWQPYLRQLSEQIWRTKVRKNNIYKLSGYVKYDSYGYNSQVPELKEQLHWRRYSVGCQMIINRMPQPLQNYQFIRFEINNLTYFNLIQFIYLISLYLITHKY